MKWSEIKWLDKSGYWDQSKFLVSDGKKIWIVWCEHNEMFFDSETKENEYDIENRLTHCANISDIDLPSETNCIRYEEQK